ncbi:MAG: nitroreductase family protein [Candidatus Bathyarchaeota archaeon]|nr:nitroreductase family protein [Candidatus Bathyarchaeota archaeon]
MEFMDVVTKRRSIRRYKPEPVPDDVLNQILEAARVAPSAGHRQPWHFIVVKDAPTKKQLGVSQWAAEAPLILVGCVDTAIRSPPLCYVDLAIGFEHIVLAAANFGLGTCWIGRLGRDETIKAVLSIPDHVRVVAVTPLGYPDETPDPKTRKVISEIIHYDAF